MIIRNYCELFTFVTQDAALHVYVLIAVALAIAVLVAVRVRVRVLVADPTALDGNEGAHAHGNGNEDVHVDADVLVERQNLVAWRRLGSRSTVLQKGKGHRMLYALLCYDSEDVVGAWTKEQDAEAIAKLEVVQEKLAKQGRLGPVARLMPTTAATTLRKGKESVVLDGPFAETKEQLLGFFIVDCASLEEAIEAAAELGRASSSMGAYEIRPLMVFKPGGLST